MAAPAPPTPFRVEATADELSDLHRRLTATRLPPNQLPKRDTHDPNGAVFPSASSLTSSTAVMAAPLLGCMVVVHSFHLCSSSPPQCVPSHPRCNRPTGQVRGQEERPKRKWQFLWSTGRKRFCQPSRKSTFQSSMRCHSFSRQYRYGRTQELNCTCAGLLTVAALVVCTCVHVCVCVCVCVCECGVSLAAL
jgi:hypothetical protein